MGQSKINRGRERRQQLRERAVELAEQRSTRTPTQQLKLLDDRLGVGVGAVKERDRLTREIEQSSKKKSTTQPKEAVERKPKGKSPKAKERRQSQRATNKK